MIRDIFKHKTSPGYGGGNPYVSPYLLEAFSTHSGAPAWTCASGAYTANTGQVFSNVGLASGGYCLGRDGLIHALGANAVRVEPAGLLVEMERTNAIVQSNTFSDAVWTKESCTVTKNVTGPDGVANSAWTFTAAAAFGQHRVYLLPTGDGPNTMYAKAGTVNFLGMWPGSSHSGAVFDLSNGTVAIDNTASATITALANGWYRCCFVGTGYYIFCGADTAAHADGDIAWTGTGAETIQVFGAQREDAVTFPSSYIPTAGTAATRNADIPAVHSPLADLSQPVPFYRARATLYAIPGATWADFSNYWTVLGNDDDGATPNTWGFYARSTNILGLDLTDGASAERYGQADPSGLADGDVLEMTNTSAGAGKCYKNGVLVSVVNSGTGTGIINPLNATLWVGYTSPGGPAGIGAPHAHHYTNIVLDNV